MEGERLTMHPFSLGRVFTLHFPDSSPPFNTKPVWTYTNTGLVSLCAKGTHIANFTMKDFYLFELKNKNGLKTCSE